MRELAQDRDCVREGRDLATDAVKNANPLCRAGAWLGCIIVLALTGCGGDETPPVAPQGIETTFPIAVGTATVHLQLALAEQEMTRGLMERTDLRANQGMLFVYREPQQMSFWMRNTPSPLEIGFFTSDGVLREVYPLIPFDERPVKSRRDDLQFAMEVLQGWFDFTGVKPGDRIDLKAVAAALKVRGYSPGDYDL